MKKNVFYLLIGCISLILLAIFWYSVEIHNPLIIEAAFIIAVALAYLIRRRVVDMSEDERSAKITEQAVLRTFQIFWVGFCAISIWRSWSSSMFRNSQRNVSSGAPVGLFTPKMIGYLQLGLLCLMIFLYVGFRMYYARKYGDWETDEE